MSREWDLQGLLDAAMHETDLYDFGEPGFAGPLAVLLKSYEEDVRFSEFGRNAYRSRLHTLLCNRLRVAEDRKRCPDIAREKIERPIFVTGLPRSGSSFLLDVLARDPDNRVPRTWEIFLSSPPPEPATYATDARIERMQRLLEEQGYADAALLLTHPFGAELAEECSFIIEQSFVSDNLASVVPAQQYAQWLATKADHGVAYRYHRRLLQNLQYRFRAERWALKAPSHMFHLQALLDEYPDAQIVVTHRDLTKVLPSIASMATALHRIFVEDTAVDPVAVGRNVVSLLSQGVRHTMEVREQLGRPAQFCDVLYSDLRSDPVKSIERIYSAFGIPLTTRARDAMSRYVESEGKARHGHGRHRYALADYEFSEPDIDREFRPYIDAYGIRREP